MSRIGISHREEKKVSVCHGVRVGGNRQGILFGVIKMSNKLYSSVIKFYTKMYRIIHFGRIEDFMVCELYLKEGIFLKTQSSQ